MIQARLQISGEIKGRETISGNINGSIKKIYPELESLEVNPSLEKQTFKSEKYGYDEVIVNEVFITQCWYIDERLDFITRFKVDKILNCATFACLCSFRYREHSKPEAFTFLSEEQHIIVVCSHEEVFNEVLITGIGAFRAFTSPTLSSIFTEVSTFNIIKVRNCNDNWIV